MGYSPLPLCAALVVLLQMTAATNPALGQEKEPGPPPAAQITPQPLKERDDLSPANRNRSRDTRQVAQDPKGNGSTRPLVEEVTILSDSQSKVGELMIYEGYVDASISDVRLQADRVTLNTVTDDMVAEGNVIFDQGTDQRVTAQRAEINGSSRTGIFWNTTGFTNRTQTGEYVYFSAERVEKTGPITYILYNATITACEDVTPKWSFTTNRAELTVDDRLKLHNTIFRIKNHPAFILPYAWIPVTRAERKSGVLLPTTGASNQKGRTLKLAYYQTLGESADVTIRNDIYSQRGLGFGAEFRARTDEKSFLRLGIFTVKDRLFGPPGDDQGGTAFIGEGVQYLPHGWLAVGNVSAVTSLPFRQVFSDDISQVIDPRRESTFYAGNNSGAFSLSFLASNETTTLFRPGAIPGSGANFDIKIRQAPEFNLARYPSEIKAGLPIYFSFNSSIGALKRQETVDGNTVLVTPGAVQRFDFEPKVIIPLKTLGGTAITPSLSYRETLYTSSIDPGVPAFNPDLFAVSSSDPRLDPGRSTFRPDVRIFNVNELDRVAASRLSRHYAEVAIDVRPPALERIFFEDDPSRRFKHLIEPYVTYRLIKGIGNEFDRIVRFDDRDAIANTNEIEYALVNRFFITRSTGEIGGRRKKRRARSAAAAGGKDRQNANTETTSNSDQADSDEQDVLVEKPQSQPYEFLTIRVAQKYFIDRTFGGALEEGRRNQFYPINTLSGFTYGGVARTFSPLNLAVNYRPLSTVFADMRMDLGSEDGGVRNVALSGGITRDNLRITGSWYLSRRIEIKPEAFEPGTFPGSQLTTVIQFGDELRGVYGGARVGYDFTDRFANESEVSRGRLRNTRSFIGYGWDCCGVQFNYNTFKAGLRSESSFSFTFTLAGLGSFGTDQFSQLGGGSGGRKRGRKRNRNDDEVFR